MRLSAVLVSAFLFVAPVLAVEDYPTQFQKLLDNQDYKGALALTAQWQKAEPQNPQPFIEEANVYFSQSYHDAIAITQKTPEAGELVMTNDQTHEKWVMGEGGSYDPVGCQKGIDLLEKTVVQYPYRVDIWLGLAYIHQQLKQYPQMLDVLGRACAYTSAHPKGLVGKDGKKIPDNSEKFMVQCLQDYCVDFSQTGDPKDMEKVYQISQIMVKDYPKNSFGYDNIGGYYAAEGKWQEAKKYYTTARDLAPKDSLEWNNLGSVYRHLGDKAEATKCYKKVVELNDDPDLVKEVKGILEKLQK